MSVDLGDIPTRGLLEVLSSWALAGDMTTVEALTAAVGSLPTLDTETAWTPGDAGRRADRMAWEHLRPVVMSLPETREEWVDALPAVGVNHTEWSESPRSPVDWAASVRKMGGWPPPAAAGGKVVYLTRRRTRQRDEAITGAMSWGREHLERIVLAAENLAASVADTARDRVAAIPKMASPLEPDYPELEALRLLGTPFTELSSAISMLLELYSDPYAYARDLLLPDHEMRWRLFHLGCYGELLAEAVERIGPVTSTRPLMAGTRRATHVLRDGVEPHVTYEFWFEASGLWRLKPGSTSHASIAKVVHGARGGLIPDIGAVRRRDGVLEKLALAEVKYSRNGQYVFGSGYAEALGYGIEGLSHFEADTLSFVAAPDDMVVGEGASVDRSVGGLVLRTGVSSPAPVANAFMNWLTA